MDISHNHTQYTDPPPAPLETQAFPGNPHLHFIKLGNLEKTKNKKTGFLYISVKPLGNGGPKEGKPQRLWNFYISQETTSTIDRGVLKISNDYKGEQLSLGLAVPQELKTLIRLFDVLRDLNSHFLRVSWHWPGSC